MTAELPPLERTSEPLRSILYDNVRTCVDELLIHGFCQFHSELDSMMAYKMKTLTVDFDDKKPQMTDTFLQLGPMGNMILQTSDMEYHNLDNIRIIKII